MYHAHCKGIGTRKSFIRERRDPVLRFMKIKKDLASSTLKKFARMSIADAQHL
jgi:hypothetical protein